MVGEGGGDKVAQAHQPTQVLGVAEINARIDRLPAWGLNPAALIVVGFCYFFAFFDITVMGVALPNMTGPLHFSSSQSTTPVTANLLAYVAGAYGFGTLADYLGRRTALRIVVLILAVGGILTALSWNLVSFTVFRTLTGLGMGAEITLAASLLGEFSPSNGRGRYLSYATFWGALGLALPPFFGLGLDQIAGIGWRLLFAIGGLAIFALPFLNDRVLPESPRWLVLHGRPDRAEAIVTRMEGRASKVSGQTLPPLATVPPEAPRTSFPLIELLRDYLGRTILVVAFWVAFYLWIYAFLSYEPTLLTKEGLSLPEGVLYTALSLIGTVAGFFLQAFVSDRIERKYVIAGGLVIAVIGLAIIAVASSPAVIVAGGFLVTAGDMCAVLPAYAYTAEIFPTRARATGMSLGDGLGHVGGALQPYIIFAILGAAGATAGARLDFWWMAAAAACSLVLMLAGGVKTNGRELTRLSR